MTNLDPTVEYSIDAYAKSTGWSCAHRRNGLRDDRCRDVRRTRRHRLLLVRGSRDGKLGYGNFAGSKSAFRATDLSPKREYSVQIVSGCNLENARDQMFGTLKTNPKGNGNGSFSFEASQ
jgi:hypothetical protein